jgi:hypothetical protein
LRPPTAGIRQRFLGSQLRARGSRTSPIEHSLTINGETREFSQDDSKVQRFHGLYAYHRASAPTSSACKEIDGRGGSVRAWRCCSAQPVPVCLPTWSRGLTTALRDVSCVILDRIILDAGRAG